LCSRSFHARDSHCAAASLPLRRCRQRHPYEDPDGTRRLIEADRQPQSVRDLCPVVAQRSQWIQEIHSILDLLAGKFGACHVALLGQSKMLAGNAGVSAEQAAKEWTANVIPGITIIPSGTWGVNRAQEAGCTYCAGG
jgi:hypothetical protein